MGLKSTKWQKLWLIAGNLIILRSLCGLLLPEQRSVMQSSRQAHWVAIVWYVWCWYNGVVYLISFIPWLSTLSSFSWGPLCRQKSTHMKTHTVYAYLHLYPQSRFSGQHTRNMFCKCNLWVWIFTGVKWKALISLYFQPILVESAVRQRLPLYCSYFVLQYCANLIIQCCSYKRLPSIPV